MKSVVCNFDSLIKNKHVHSFIHVQRNYFELTLPKNILTVEIVTRGSTHLLFLSLVIVFVPADYSYNPIDAHVKHTHIAHIKTYNECRFSPLCSDEFKVIKCFLQD